MKIDLKIVGGIAAGLAIAVGTYAICKKNPAAGGLAVGIIGTAAACALGVENEKAVVSSIDNAEKILNNLAEAEELAKKAKKDAKAEQAKASSIYNKYLEEKDDLFEEAKNAAKKDCYAEFEKEYHEEYKASVLRNMTRVTEILTDYKGDVKDES